MASNGITMASDKHKLAQMAIDEDAYNKNNEVVDPWALVDPPMKGKSWEEKSAGERFSTLMVTSLKVIILLGLLYFFICSLDLLSDSFRLLGGKAAGEAFRNNEILQHPIAGLMIGVLVTVLVQSSSTTTSIIVSMVAAELVTVRPAIFMIMGANIGTSVTNTIVSLGQAMDRNEFRRAFAGATVHDMFNWLAVIILLPIEWLSGLFGNWKGCGCLCQLTGFMVEALDPKKNKNAKQDLLKVITKPFTSLIIQIDKKVLNKIAEGTVDSSNASLIKHSCDAWKPRAVFNADNASCSIEWYEGKGECLFMFENVSQVWTDAAVGTCLLVLALAGLCICLVLIVKLLHSLLRGRLAIIIKRFVNADFPGFARHFTGYLAILIGAGLTMLLQSSSIFTSAMTPLVGVGVLHLDRMYPLTLGANIGTTFTAILAALASDNLQKTLQVALCHLFFNIIGILIWYPIPAMRNIPISLARALGNKTAKHRWVAVVYLLVMFFLFPAAVFGLSLANTYAVVGVALFVLLIVFFIGIVNCMQGNENHKRHLPTFLRTWDFLPRPLHSLKPYEACCTCCCHRNKRDEPTEVITKANGHTNQAYTHQDNTEDPGTMLNSM